MEHSNHREVRNATKPNLTSGLGTVEILVVDLETIVFRHPAPDFTTTETVRGISLVVPSDQCSSLLGHDFSQDCRNLWTNLRLACCIRRNYGFLMCHVGER